MVHSQQQINASLINYVNLKGKWNKLMVNFGHEPDTKKPDAYGVWNNVYDCWC